MRFNSTGISCAVKKPISLADSSLAERVGRVDCPAYSEGRIVRSTQGASLTRSVLRRRDRAERAEVVGQGLEVIATV